MCDSLWRFCGSLGRGRQVAPASEVPQQPEPERTLALGPPPATLPFTTSTPQVPTGPPPEVPPPATKAVHLLVAIVVLLLLLIIVVSQLPSCGSGPPPERTADWGSSLSSSGEPSPYGPMDIVEGEWQRFSNGYELNTTQLGSGATGKVILGRNTLTKTFVAVKVPPVTSGPPVSGGEVNEALRREAELLKSIPTHANIVSFLDFQGEYLILEYVDGFTLQRLYTLCRVPAEALLDYTKQLARGLGHLHENGFLHRDLKPANVMLDTSNTVKIIDFGLSVRERALRAGPSDGAIAGTPQYMAPELLLEGQRPTAAADIWALGCTVLACATQGQLWPQCEEKLPAQIAMAMARKELPFRGREADEDYYSAWLPRFLRLTLDYNQARATAAGILEQLPASSTM
eukprot:TRINITY_DN67371_c0_g1_i1.p1 TRINITY_DN67371_c0_g1~~TRINITY_DN67371_c0_g1_i1.p1  ORF type:complete len:444 (+),score=59.40 TRINITY_DN67371_c0_g1_i1:130-1332(+)